MQKESLDHSMMAPCLVGRSALDLDLDRGRVPISSNITTVLPNFITSILMTQEHHGERSMIKQSNISPSRRRQIRVADSPLAVWTDVTHQSCLR